LSQTKVQIYNTYGHTEGAVVAITNSGSNQMHLMPQIGITEIVNEKDEVLTEPGQRGRIIVTGFNNNVFPFIRYRTDDFAVIGENEKESILHYDPIKSVEGRLQDYIISKSNALVPAAPLLFDYNFDWSQVERFQIVQDSPGEIMILICLVNRKKDVSETIYKRFEEMIGMDFKINVSVVEDIPYTSRGKFRYVQQKLNINDYIR